MRGTTFASALSAILVLAAVAIAAGQQRTPPAATAATMDDVLNELRALRTEVRDSSAASLRAQLLVARLQLQEQRINTVWRQLSDVEEQLVANEKGRAGPEQMFKMMGIEPGTEASKEMGPLIEMFKSQMAAVEKTEADLKLRQAELTQLLAQEQSRWTSFNAQLEALEKAVTAITPQR